MNSQKLDGFIEQRGLFCLTVLRLEAKGWHLEVDLLLTESRGSMVYYTEQDREGRRALITQAFLPFHIKFPGVNRGVSMRTIPKPVSQSLQI